jgi:hypothetical protein
MHTVRLVRIKYIKLIQKGLNQEQWQQPIENFHICQQRDLDVWPIQAKRAQLGLYLSSI